MEEKKYIVDVERIRRITGYLAKTTMFNDAKKAELKERVKHISVKR